MKVLRSFRFKTVIYTLLLSGCFLAVFGWMGWRWIEKRSLDALDSRILVPGQRLVEYHGWATDWQRFNESIVAAFGEDWLADRVLLVRSNMYQRDRLFHSENWPQELEIQDVPDLEAAAKKVRMVRDADEKGFLRYELIARPWFYSVEAGGKRWRMVTLSNPEITFYIGINEDRFQGEIRKLKAFYFGSLSVLLLLMGGGALVIASRAMRPIRIITETARNITSRDLNQRIRDSQLFDSEFDALIGTINGMLERLDSSFHQAMRFSADASHELKTPIANIQNELLARLQRCIPDSDEHRTLNEILHELDRLKRIMKGLFLFSQADAGKMPLTMARYHFSDSIETLVKDAQVLAEEEFELKFEAEIEAGVCIHGDEIMVGQVVQNLINNAISHNVESGWLKLSLVSREEKVVLRVENSAVPIPAEEQGRVFHRFQRGSHTRHRQTPGLGLGLSLASEIVRAHAGSLILLKSDQDSTIFEMRLPKTPCPETNSGTAGETD